MKKILTSECLLFGCLVLAVACSPPVFAAAPSSSAVTGENSTRGETPLGNLVADALRTAAKSDVALLQAGLIEENRLPVNADSLDAIRRVFTAPGETVVTLRIRGEQLRGALERSVSLSPRKNRGFLQVSGLAILFDAGRPENARIMEVKVNGQSLDTNRVYTAAMPSSLAGGALGYFKFWNDKEAKPVTGTGGAKLTLADVLLARVKTGRVATSTDNRIRSRGREECGEREAR